MVKIAYKLGDIYRGAPERTIRGAAQPSGIQVYQKPEMTAVTNPKKGLGALGKGVIGGAAAAAALATALGVYNSKKKKKKEQAAA